LACVSYQRLVYQEKLEALRASTLAEYAVRRVRGGRRVGGRQNFRDALCSSAYRAQGFEVRSLTPSREDQDVWKATLIECRRTLPSDMAAFRIDLDQGLRVSPGGTDGSSPRSPAGRKRRPWPSGSG
jgi:hypothetical protein